MTEEDAPEGIQYADLNRRADLDRALRPPRLDEFIGQERLRNNLRVAITATKKRDEPLDHLLFSGLPGLGKTTLAHIIAVELGVELRITSGPALERTGDLVGLLTNLKRGDILFIDEIHRLPRVLEEYLYSAMEDLAIDIVIDQGPAARSVRLTLERFTLVGATTREGLLTAAFRSRFGLLEKLELYPPSEITRVLERSARLLEIACDDDALELISECARGTPRVANRLLRRVRDLCDVRAADRLTADLAREMLTNLGIDEAGLQEMDRKILRCLHRVGGGPTGLKTIAAAVGEEDDTIESVYEPYLLSLGFITKTSRGRQLTDNGRRHLGATGGSGQESLF